LATIYGSLPLLRIDPLIDIRSQKPGVIVLILHSCHRLASLAWKIGFSGHYRRSASSLRRMIEPAQHALPARPVCDL